MEIIDVLKIQNRFIESQGENEKIKALKMFNEELIEKLEFENIYPFVFSERVTRLLVKYGFYYCGISHGKSYRSYDKANPNCRLCWGQNNDIDFFMKDKSLDNYHWDKISIEKEDSLTEEYLIKLLSMAVAPSCP